MADKKSFIFYDNWSQLVCNMPVEQAGALIQAVCSYRLGEPKDTGDVMVDAIVKMITSTIDEDAKKYADICEKRSEAKKSKQMITNDNKCEQMITNDNKCSQVSTNAHDKDKDKDKDKYIKENNIKEKPVKHKYGEYGNVLLTDEEFAKIKDKFPSDYQSWIDRLSGYIESKGVKYKSHYATILNWSRNERASPKANEFKAHTQQTYDFDELEKKLIANG